MARPTLLLGLLAAALVVVDAQQPVRGPWTCNETTGIKTRTVQTWNRGRMTETVESAPCDPVACVVYTKETDPGEWGACNREWDGLWYHYKVLGIQTEAKWGGSCPNAFLRRIRERCMPVACVVKTAAEETTNTFGSCNVEADGSYYKYKTLGIKTAALYGGTCPTEAQRQYKELCPASNCVYNAPADETSSFGDCEEGPVGTWYQYRTLTVTTPEQYGGTCPTDAERQDKKLCPASNCVYNAPADETSSFGDCKEGPVGTWYQYRTLTVTTPEQYGGTCPTEAERQDKKLCPASNCVVKTAAEETTNTFGACQQEGAAWYKYKTLGVKTPEQYGGTCPTEAQRQYQELCPPVPCVVKTAAEDTGPFGRCQQESDGWYKYKVLGIKTLALYGGSCPSESDLSRRVRAPCTRTCRPLAPGYGIGSASYFETNLSASSSTQCCELCKARPKCEAYVFYTNTRKCWIQSALRTQFRSVTAVGGTMLST